MKAQIRKTEHSIAGDSAAQYVAQDSSLAALVRSHGIRVRDFIVLSFLCDQGPMSILRLSRIIGIEPDRTLRSLKRLSAASLVLRDPTSTNQKYDATARLTTRGREIAAKISSQAN